MIDKLNLIGILRSFCQANGIYFIPGPVAYQNAVMDRSIYDEYDLIMVADLLFRPVFSDNDLSEVAFQGTISLGRKREEETVSSLDETFEQKYDRRLLDLSHLFSDLLLELQCDYGAEIDSVRMSYALNQYDLNADFVTADVQITL